MLGGGGLGWDVVPFPARGATVGRASTHRTQQRPPRRQTPTFAAGHDDAPHLTSSKPSLFSDEDGGGGARRNETECVSVCVHASLVW